MRCSEKYAHWLMSYGFDGIVHLNTAKKFIDDCQAKEAGFTGEQKKSYDELKAAYTAALTAWDKASLSMKSGDNRTMTITKKDLRNKTTALAKLLAYKEKIDWTYSHNYWWQEPRINKVYVDFN